MGGKRPLRICAQRFGAGAPPCATLIGFEFGTARRNTAELKALEVEAADISVMTYNTFSRREMHIAYFAYA